ncbi:hypothetical protein PH547_11060 [Rhizobium sp. CNPSo 3464]|uniref:hypothetical protein n=1 Tax=Rhizobium sp. CNPSo 3464 TaxID=3021406 RepID=UPI00254E6B7E|nr:hypothetical protein [Rhizobium sp. CNPSo 3464]MDK4739412.1 hypothetical protein [Rhizobium sp. CNPSo 3464]
MTTSVMNDVTLKIGSGTLVEFLDRIGLSQTARDRVVEIDQTLAVELEKSTIDHDRCADLVLEAADLVSGRLRPLVQSSGGFDFDEMDCGSDDAEEIDAV